MYVAETGTKEADSIVFLHGGGLAGWMWNQQVSALQDYHCLVPDLPGHGESAAIPWVSFSDTADKLAEMITSKANGGRAHVVGLSLGGYLVVELLSRHAHVVDHAMLTGINALPYPGTGIMKVMTKMMAPFVKLEFLAKASLKSMKVPEENLDDYLTSLRKIDEKAYVKMSNQALDFRAPAMPENLQCPTLVMAGEKEVSNVLKSQPVLVQNIPGAVGRIAPKVGHVWSAEAPKLFSCTLRSWVEDQPLPGELIIPE